MKFSSSRSAALFPALLGPTKTTISLGARFRTVPSESKVDVCDKRAVIMLPAVENLALSPDVEFRETLCTTTGNQAAGG